MKKMETNKLYLGDCYQLIKDIPDKSIDLVYTDPPYEIGEGGMSGLFKYKGRSQKYMTEIIDNKFAKGFDYSLLDELVRVMKYIYIYIWCSKDQIPKYIKYFVEDRNCNFEIIIWHKTNTPPFTCGHYVKDKEYCLLFWEKGKGKFYGNFDTMKTVLESQVNMYDKNLYDHPTIKPLEFVKNHIINSTKPNDIVLDCFMGSGTTCVACKETGRRYIGMEINQEYYKIAEDRLKGITKTGQMSLDLFAEQQELDL